MSLSFPSLLPFLPFLLLLLSLSPPLPSVHSQTCESLSPYSVCYSILSYSSVYIPPGYCQTTMEQSIETRLLPLLTPSCQNANAQYQCASVYKPCSNHTLPVPLAICESLQSGCDNANDGNVFSYYPSPVAPSCDPTGTVPLSAVVSSNPIPRYGHCEAYSGTLCSGVITTPIYIAANFTQNILENMALTATAAFVAAPIVTGCQDSLYKLFCGHVFPPCVTDVEIHNFPIPFPSFPSQSTCQSTTNICPQQILDAMGINCTNSFSFVNCNNNPSYTFEQYPSVETAYPGIYNGYNGNAVFQVPSNSLSAFSTPSSRCPYPLISPDSPDSPPVFPGAQCVFPCELPAFTHEEWQEGWVLHLVFSTLSFISCAFMVLTWRLFSPDKSGSPTFWILVSLLGLSGSSFFASFAAYSHPLHGSSGASRFICENNGSPIKQSDGGGCVFQAVMLVFFGHSAAAWLCASILDVYLVLVYQSYSWTKEMIVKKRKIYHVFIWSNSLFIIILMLGDGNFGSPHGLLPFCFGSNVDWAWIIEQIHLCLYYAIVPFLITGIILYLRRHINHTLMQANRSVLKEYIRLWILTGLFAIWLVGVTQSILIFLLVESSVYQTYSEQWATCVLTIGSPNCSRPPYLSKSAWLLMIFALDSFGCFAAGVFLSADDLNHWRKFFRRLKRQLLRQNLDTLSSRSDKKSTVSGKSGGSGENGRGSRENSRSRSRERERERENLSNSNDPGMVSLHLGGGGKDVNHQHVKLVPYSSLPNGNGNSGGNISPRSKDGDVDPNDLPDAPQMTNSQYDRMTNSILTKGDKEDEQKIFQQINNKMVRDMDRERERERENDTNGQDEDADNGAPLMSTSQYDRMAASILTKGTGGNPSNHHGPTSSVADFSLQGSNNNNNNNHHTDSKEVERRDSNARARSTAANRNSQAVSNFNHNNNTGHHDNDNVPAPAPGSHIPSTSVAHEVRGGRALSDDCQWNPLTLQPVTEGEGGENHQQRSHEGSDPFGLGQFSLTVKNDLLK